MAYEVTGDSGSPGLPKCAPRPTSGDEPSGTAIAGGAELKDEPKPDVADDRADTYELVDRDEAAEEGREPEREASALWLAARLFRRRPLSCRRWRIS